VSDGPSLVYLAEIQLFIPRKWQSRGLNFMQALNSQEIKLKQIQNKFFSLTIFDLLFRVEL
jgi:hypothetical protein